MRAPRAKGRTWRTRHEAGKGQWFMKRCGRTMRLDVSITAGKPEIMGLKRSWTSQISRAVSSGTSFPSLPAALVAAANK